MIGAIVQARMTSTRLPGKVLLSINGRPVIDYLFTQLQHVSQLDTIVLATTTNVEDDPLIKYAEEQNLFYFRGSEHDVLERYYYAAKQYNIQHVMRITADCPFQDPNICNQIIELYMKEQTDFVHTGPTFAEGLDCEIFSLKALEEAYHHVKLKSEREHLTLYMHSHADHYNKLTLSNTSDDSQYRFTLDQEEDFQVISGIIEGLSLDKNEIFTAEKIISFLNKNPHIFDLNSGIVRNEGLVKSLKNDTQVK